MKYFDIFLVKQILKATTKEEQKHQQSCMPGAAFRHVSPTEAGRQEMCGLLCQARRVFVAVFYMFVSSAY